jgi:predicted helicase
MGTRENKFNYLNDHWGGGEFASIQNPASPNYDFRHVDRAGELEYSKYISVKNLFISSGSGIKFRKDKLLISTNYTKSHAKQMVNDVVNLEKSQLLNKYRIKETSDWQLEDQRKNFINSTDEDYIAVEYRPFDYRWSYYPLDKINKIIPRGDSRHGLMRHMLKNKNLSLNTCRQQSSFDFQHVLISDAPTDMCTVSLQTKETGYAFPLYLYHDDGTRTPNFNSDELAALTKNLSVEYSPEDILDYIYAILHSPSYREKNKEFLKIDFPRVPIIKSDAEFARLVPLGKRLRELHLMKANDIDNYETTFPEAGDDTVDKIRYEDGKVYINDSQYFGNVPELAWNFYIGGYQPAQKWLKDRRTRKLKSDDTTHYQRIIKILSETNNVMHEINVTNE